MKKSPLDFLNLNLTKRGQGGRIKKSSTHIQNEEIPMQKFMIANIGQEM